MQPYGYMHLRNRALYAVSPSSNTRAGLFAWPAPPPPGGSPSDSQGARRARDLGPSHNWERISATKRFHRLHDTVRVSPFCVVPRATVSMLPAMRCHIVHKPNHGVAAHRLSGAKKQTAASGIRKAPCSLAKGRRSGALGLAGEPVEQDTDGPGAGRLFVEDSRDISHASLLRACGVRTGDQPVSRPEYPGAWEIAEVAAPAYSHPRAWWPDSWAFC